MNGYTPAGAVRRARALASRGWAPEAIARATGIPADDCRRALENRRVISADAATRIAAAYDRLWNRPPPQASDTERQAAQAVTQRARIRGWAPPAAWDDDQLDQPDGAPAPGWQRNTSTHQRAVDIAEDVAFVREHGGYRHASTAQVSMRLGLSKDTVDQALLRAAWYAQRDADREAG